MAEAFGTRTPLAFDGAVIAATSRLPDNWLGLRLAILLRRFVTMRLASDLGFDVERWGMRMRLHPLRNGCEKGALFTPQMYEAGERRELQAAIAESRAGGQPFVFIDIGANVGLFSLFVASRTGADARILAFEPEPGNVARLRFNVAANPGAPIQVFALALGAAAGTVLLDPNQRDKGGTRTRRLEDGRSAADAARVECRTLLEVLLRESVPSVDALKIDVEGTEPDILLAFFRDAPQPLWPRLLIVEDARSTWPVDLFAELQRLGYAVASRTRLNVMMRRP